MTHTIIFSFDRAIQLEVLLKSIEQYDGEKNLTVSVLYSYSTADHLKSYQQLSQKFSQVNWVEEKRFKKKPVLPIFPSYWHNYYWWLRYKYSRVYASHFRQQLLEIIRNNSASTVMFLTDDSMFFDEIRIPRVIIEKLEEKPTLCSFSLRHGRNLGGGNFVELDGYLYWNIYDPQEHPEWSFPFSIDGHIYEKDFIDKTFSKVWFKNPNTLEGNIACYVREKKILSTVYGNTKSCLVGFELNRVQTISNNNNLNISSNYLNTLFNNGYRMRIAFDPIKNQLFRPDKFRVDACREDSTINIITVS